MTLSALDAQILEYIKTQIRTQGYPPTLREIAKAVGLRSTATVHTHMNRLEAMGKLRRDPSKPRALEVTDGTMPSSCSIPLVGSVPAGTPMFAEENIEAYISVPSFGADDDTLFALRVQGESMIEAGILNRDVIIVTRTDTADNGQIVVAMIDGEATVKRIFYEEKRVRLQPENRYMEPIYSRHVQVIGKVVGLFRMIG